MTANREPTAEQIERAEQFREKCIADGTWLQMTIIEMLAAFAQAESPSEQMPLVCVHGVLLEFGCSKCKRDNDRGNGRIVARSDWQRKYEACLQAYNKLLNERAESPGRYGLNRCECGYLVAEGIACPSCGAEPAAPVSPPHPSKIMTAQLYRSLNRLHLAVKACAAIGFEESSPINSAHHAAIWKDLNEAQADAALKLRHFADFAGEAKR